MKFKKNVCMVLMVLVVLAAAPLAAATQITDTSVDTTGTVNADSGYFSGKVGIGRPNPAYDIQIWNELGRAQIMLNTEGDDANDIFFGTNTVPQRYSISARGSADGHDLRIYRNNIFWDPMMVFDWDTGNVGIGTTTGIDKQLVVGGTFDMRLQEIFGWADLTLRSSTDDKAKIWLDNDPSTMKFYTGATEAMTIDSTGNVGVGTTDPNNKLHVAGGGAGIDIGDARNVNSAKAGLNIHDLADGGSWTNIQLVERGWSGSHGILFNAYKSATQVNGNLATLGNTKYANYVDDPDDPGTPYYANGAGMIAFFANGGIMDFYISPESTGKDNDVDWGTPKMRIFRNGRVGIGIASPAAELDVAGTVKATAFQGDGSQLTGIPGDTDWEEPVAGGNIYRLSGNVGVGTDNPQASLDIGGNVKTYTLTRDIPTALNEYVELGYITGQSFSAKVTISKKDGYAIGTKKYQLTSAWGPIDNWREVIPQFNTGVSNGNDFTLDASWTGVSGPLNLRVRLSKYSTNPNTPPGTPAQDQLPFEVSIEIEGNGVFTETSATESTTAPTEYYPRSALTQYNDKVGIGTASPGKKLDVNGDIRTNVALIGDDAHSGYAAFSHRDQGTGVGYALLQHSTGTTFLNAPTGKNINFRINNENKMILKSDGNVGIGTASPTVDLDIVEDSGRAQIGLYTQGNDANDIFLGTNGVSQRYSISARGSADGHDLRIYRNNGGWNPMINFDWDTGNVGIGTTTPVAKLDVAGSLKADSATFGETTRIGDGNGIWGGTITDSYTDVAGIIRSQLHLSYQRGAQLLYEYVSGASGFIAGYNHARITVNDYPAIDIGGDGHVKMGTNSLLYLAKSDTPPGGLACDAANEGAMYLDTMIGTNTNYHLPCICLLRDGNYRWKRVEDDSQDC